MACSTSARVTVAGRWLLAGALGGAVAVQAGLVAGHTTTYVLLGGMGIPVVGAEHGVVALLAGLAVGGTLYGALTAATLVWLLRRTASEATDRAL